MPGERSSFESPVEPISPPPKPASSKRASVEAPGTAPGSERPIATSIYRHSRPCGRHGEYRRPKRRREAQFAGGGRRLTIGAEGRHAVGGPNGIARCEAHAQFLDRRPFGRFDDLRKEVVGKRLSGQRRAL